VNPEERILILEDTPELTLPATHKHALYLRTRLRDAAGSPDVALRDLVINTLRMRPDRVIVGETRGPEAADMLQAMNVGQDGLMTTLHANSAREAIGRLETLVLQAGIDMPLKAIRQNIVSALDFIVFLSRLADGSRRIVQVAEVTGLEVDTVSMADLFLLDLRRGAGGLEGRLRSAGTIPRFYERLRRQGVEAAAPLLPQRFLTLPVVIDTFAVESPGDEMAKKVLVIDDEPEILSLVKYTLEQAGFEVHTCDKRPHGVGRDRQAEARRADPRRDAARHRRLLAAVERCPRIRPRRTCRS